MSVLMWTLNSLLQWEIRWSNRRKINVGNWLNIINNKQKANTQLKQPASLLEEREQTPQAVLSRHPGPKCPKCHFGALFIYSFIFVLLCSLMSRWFKAKTLLLVKFSIQFAHKQLSCLQASLKVWYSWTYWKHRWHLQNFYNILSQFCEAAYLVFTIKQGRTTQTHVNIVKHFYSYSRGCFRCVSGRY